MESVTVNVGNTGASDIQGAVVRLASDCGVTFTDRTTDLTSGQNRDLVFNYTAGCTDCTCAFTAEIDPDDEICECDDADNTDASPLDMDVADLAVTDIVFNPGCADDNISGAVTVVVENRGCRAATDFRVALDTDGCLDFTDRTVDALVAGASMTLVFSISDSWARCADCALEFTAEVDPSHEVCERAGDNNQAGDAHSPDLPNLAVNGVTPWIDDYYNHVTVQVSNTGPGGAADAMVRVVSDCDVEFDDRIIDLPSGESMTLEFEVVGAGPDRECVFTARIDPGNEICECGDGDNILSTPPYLPPPFKVPTLTEWGMILLALLLAGLSIRIMRRRGSI